MLRGRPYGSWREPRTPFRSIGEIYLGSEMFSDEDEAAKTIGKAAIGPDAVNIIENRRKVKGRLSELGKAELEKVVAKVKRLFPDSEVKAAWDIHCGCSMCSCSPGYRIKVKAQRIHSSSNKSRFNLHIVSEEGKVKYTFFKPEDSWTIGYDNVEKLVKEFTDGQ
jgi:hypothetical protein